MLLNDPLFLLAAGASLVVLLILLLGIASFAKGGDFNRRNANRLMRYRIIAQFAAVVVIVGFVLIRKYWE